MSYYDYQMHLKNILDLTLFGAKNIDESFADSEAIRFSEEYINYFLRYRKEDSTVDNYLLSKNCLLYLHELTDEQKIEISRFFYDYRGILRFIYTEKDSMKLKNHSMASLFELEFESYFKANHISDNILQFFQIYFSQFKNVDLNVFSNYEIDKNDYLLLLKFYLSPQDSTH